MGRRSQYSFGKRQREIKRKEKADKKRLRRQGPSDPETAASPDGGPPAVDEGDSSPPDPGTSPDPDPEAAD
jgi:hypothetical protein